MGKNFTIVNLFAFWLFWAKLTVIGQNVLKITITG
jgi:hypothetical protein